ncbi:hypothetical protein A3D66_00825 [Candidatus Kaiserbacteria bacterium RIFCSPHIGHO2_02_FULL_50_9]|uniref:Uncharacterized protein n=1 Tax=Candidatus Kaiserbacteria bacterium RIFCSPLOWO2_01_FULL_51_21 TaxID=1798508 RepID=A0A1F6ECQ6_9BACT|nr:MAG: hypothetical protein A2761_00950 [Candidatus Kaiserbacteria bacterium RIFCSPHIGHO2_01_FULL_51_33]OGG63471.1 MAG: hypothetical protein A3D66_00825 [Candidatus Kaiserbacteria bacterium RIFCSPHIGHO2_02_FULL_50_9]OGG71463.1 MAG: hypothetical protein A3A35_03400 [Candidatus Kaiserbacteria bacterium RIFCSPLOWO2_01_FULL_51_21]
MDIRFLNLEYLFLLIYNLLTGQHETSIPGHLLEYWETYKIIATFLTLFLATGIIYCVVRIFQIRKEERAELGIIFKPVTSEEKQNTDWERILEHSKSDNPNDWKQAIIDADVLLEKMVDVMGYRGENLGEKLKQIEQSDFKNLDNAWEAHKVRNQIAHAGSNFVLTEREARRVIDLYRQAFEEFKFLEN